MHELSIALSMIDMATQESQLRGGARGNGVAPCPSSYDLGENLRLVLMSVTEGEDKPLKYPTIFNTADVAVLTKLDLADAVEFDVAAARENIQAVRPGMKVFELSVKSGEGVDEYLGFLDSHLAPRMARASCP